jgi:hypothetical protein
MLPVVAQFQTQLVRKELMPFLAKVRESNDAHYQSRRFIQAFDGNNTGWLFQHFVALKGASFV